jgi:hypothetical protein
LAALAAAATLFATAEQSLASCRPKRPLTPITLKTMGPCAFNPESLSFAGNPAEQAACLLRPVGKLAKLGPALDELPDVLARRVGSLVEFPDRDDLSGYLSQRDLETDFAAYLWQPVSHARDNDPTAPVARYLVIHDTSGPNFGRAHWPQDLDDNRKINNLARHRCADGWESAHVFIDRTGRMLLGHDFSHPWRATKFERATQFGTSLKGLFLHVELVQPRRRDPRRGRRDDSVAPLPGFTARQYARLALIYVIASVRAGRWLIPAFHAVIDRDIRNGHDDPQNFEVAAFAASLKDLLRDLPGRDQPIVSLEQ